MSEVKQISNYKINLYRIKNKFEFYTSGTGSFIAAIYNSQTNSSGRNTQKYDYKSGIKIKLSFNELFKMEEYFDKTKYIINDEKFGIIKDLQFFHKFATSSGNNQKTIIFKGKYNSEYSQIQYLFSIKDMSNSINYGVYVSVSELMQIFDYFKTFLHAYYKEEYAKLLSIIGNNKHNDQNNSVQEEAVNQTEVTGNKDEGQKTEENLW